MTNSEALKELLVAVGGAEPEGAQTNLELLNAISEQLGGDADAESNAAAIHNIAQNASGGGGGSSSADAIVVSNFDSTGVERALLMSFYYYKVRSNPIDIKTGKCFAYGMLAGPTASIVGVMLNDQTYMSPFDGLTLIVGGAGIAVVIADRDIDETWQPPEGEPVEVKFNKGVWVESNVLMNAGRKFDFVLAADYS